MLDNNLPPALAESLNALSKTFDHSVHHLRSRFADDAPDIQWIRELAEEGSWCIVTQDRLVRSKAEKEALRLSGLVTFVLKSGWSSLDYWDKAWQLTRWWPRIIDQGVGIAGPAAFGVPVRFSGRGQFEQYQL